MPTEHRLEMDRGILAVGHSVCDIYPVSRYFSMTHLKDQQVYSQKKKKKKAAHGGILQPASTAGTQYFFKHINSNNGMSHCSGTARGTAGRYWCHFTSKGHLQLHSSGTWSHGRKFSHFFPFILSALLLWSFFSFPSLTQQD